MDAGKLNIFIMLNILFRLCITWLWTLRPKKRSFLTYLTSSASPVNLDLFWHHTKIKRSVLDLIMATISKVLLTCILLLLLTTPIRGRYILILSHTNPLLVHLHYICKPPLWVFSPFPPLSTILLLHMPRPPQPFLSNFASKLLNLSWYCHFHSQWTSLHLQLCHIKLHLLYVC